MTEMDDMIEPSDTGMELSGSGGGGAAAAVAHAQLSKRSEELFRGMWASIFYSGRATGKTVLLSGASRREGASTIACGLSLVDSDIAGAPRVALVDFNLRFPAVHKLLGLRQEPGLAEALTQGQDLKSLAQKVNQNLDVFTVGAVTPSSLDVLHSNAIATLFQRLGESYDYILVDTAAANPYPDAQVLASVVKDVVLVVHSDQTPREAVAQAKKRIEAGGGRVVGLVLNLRTFPIPNFLYRRL